MAHQLEVHNGQASFVSARQSAWHKLGTIVDKALTAEEAMRLAHLGGWNVRKIPLTATELTNTGVTQLEVPERYVTARTSPFTGETEALGVVGSSYHVIQNEEHAEFLNRLTDESGAHFETAGSLRGGTQTFITMKIPQTMLVGGVDPVNLYLAAFNSHDGSSAFRICATPIRVVCANTQAQAWGCKRSSVSIRHTRGAKNAIAQARKALELSFAWFDDFEEEAERMIDKTMTDAKFNSLIAEVFGTPSEEQGTRAMTNHQDRLDRLHWLFADAQTNKTIAGTAWAGYQAVTEYIDHYSPTRSADTDNARALRVITSDEATRLKNRAFALARN